MILLDLGLPDIDGIEVIRRIREWSPVPIIVLSVREHEGDKIAALDAGADDYLTKPFGVGELLARIRAALRRSLQQVPEPVYTSGELQMDLNLRRPARPVPGISLPSRGWASSPSQAATTSYSHLTSFASRMRRMFR